MSFNKQSCNKNLLGINRYSITKSFTYIKLAEVGIIFTPKGLLNTGKIKTVLLS